MFSKIVDVYTSLSDIKDDSIIAISGFNMATTPEYIILELYKQYSQQGHPKNIFIISDALPAVPGRALDQIGESLYKEANQEFLRGALMHIKPRHLSVGKVKLIFVVIVLYAPKF
jgi:acyl CoA:acetate/3-ketoacid CoA transferase